MILTPNIDTNFNGAGSGLHMTGIAGGVYSDIRNYAPSDNSLILNITGFKNPPSAIWYDKSVNKFQMSLVNYPSYILKDSAVSFNGSSYGLITSNYFKFPAITVSFWFKVIRFNALFDCFFQYNTRFSDLAQGVCIRRSGADQIVFSGGATSGTKNFYINGKLAAVGLPSDIVKGYIIADSALINKWNHITLTVENTTVWNTHDRLTIASDEAFGNRASIIVRNLTIHNRVLTDAEICQNYQTTKPY